MNKHRALSPFTALLPLALAITAALTACSVVPQARQSNDRPPVIVTERLDTDPPPRRENTMQRIMLERHNALRTKWNIKPLVWSEGLESDAQAYADFLARNRRFEHADQSGWAMRQSENLWKGTKGAFTYDEMVGSWIAEGQFFKHGVVLDNSTTGRWNDISHYTAIIWSTTTHVGCAMASNFAEDYLVCRYSPAGNVYGQNPLGG
jgi:uncharacterized protein YkwD